MLMGSAVSDGENEMESVVAPFTYDTAHVLPFEFAASVPVVTLALAVPVAPAALLSSHRREVEL